MLFDNPVASTASEALIRQAKAAPLVERRWGADSEHGRLADVLVAPPPRLEVSPSGSARLETLTRELLRDAEAAERQHAALVRALGEEDVRCAILPADEALPDLVFARDAALMTPWGLLALRPAAEHRRREAEHVLRYARGWGVPCAGAIDEGSAEGGDVCLLRAGVAAIGWSGEGTDKAGALALAHFFRTRGWQAILTRIDPYFRHLNALLSMVDSRRAVACLEALDPAFIGEVRALGIDILPATPFEVQRLGTSLLSLGDRRVLSSADNGRINVELARLGYRVTAVDLSCFTRLGGGVHRLVLPLSRASA